MQIWLTLMVGLCLWVCSLAGAEELPHVISTPDKEQQLKEAQRLFDEGAKLLKEGMHNEAEKTLKQALTSREALLGPEHMEVAACLNLLGAVYQILAQYDQAEVPLQRALHILESASESNPPDVANSLYNLASLYTELGKYDRAEPLFHRALRIQESTVGPNHPDVASTLDTLADAYRFQGQYDRAEPLYQRAMRILEMASGTNHPMFAQSMNHLAILYRNQGQYERAEGLHQQALQIREATLGPNHPDVAGSLTNLAFVYLDQGKYDQVGPLAQRALRIKEATLGPNHPAVANSLINLALLYWHQAKYDLAEPLAQRALRIREATLGPNHPAIAYCLHVLALISSMQQKLSQTFQYERMAFAQNEKYLQSQSLVLSEEGITSLLTSWRTCEEELYSLLLQNLNYQPFMRLALSVALLRKGRTADEAAQFSQAVYRSLSEPDRQQFTQLRALRSRFSALSLAGPGKLDLDSYRRQLEELDSQANAIEEDLARRSAPLRERRNLPGIDNIVEQVAAQLKTGSTLVELIAFHQRALYLPKARQPNELRYLAFIISGDHRVTVVDLGMAKPIEDAAERLHAALSDPSVSYGSVARELFDKLIRPLIPVVISTDQFIVSPDGQLHLVPFDVLNDGKTLLGDRVRISYISSGRDLVMRELAGKPSTDMVVFADPNFGARSSASGNEAITLGTSRGQRGLRPAFLDPLPGARREAETLKQIVPSARLLLGKEATEPALLGLSAPGILHIATHGLFADDLTGLNRSRSAHSHFEEDAVPPPNHPLLRSALALAGAASYQPSGDAQDSDRPDGLVTALELASVNLWGTQLVVLSACNTGRGRVQLGQGVYGLRRALITAGAETLVASLWKVNDEATQELMTGYYQRLRQGEGRAEAMQHAAREIRQKRPHPYFWASFVVIGRGEPLRGHWYASL